MSYTWKAEGDGKARTRTYNAVGEHSRNIRRVICQETYRGSQHWWVSIIPEGYGSSPEPIVFAKKEENSSFVQQEEGYGHFRPEFAFALAASLTGTTEFTES